jgi:hypothetical protein
MCCLELNNLFRCSGVGAKPGFTIDIRLGGFVRTHTIISLNSSGTQEAKERCQELRGHISDNKFR